MNGKRISVLLICSLLQLTLFSQDDCFKKFLQRGDSAINKRNWEFAIKQFQAAKYCEHSYKKILLLDSIINATYTKWIKESEDARKAVEDASIKTLLEDANQLFLKEDFIALKAKLNTSVYNSRLSVTDYLTGIKPFAPDWVMNEVSSIEPFSFNGNNFIAVIQKKKVNAGRPLKKKKFTQADPDSISTDRTLQTDVNKIFQFKVLNPASNSLNEVYSFDLPALHSDDDSYLFLKRNDTLFIEFVREGYLYTSIDYYYDTQARELRPAIVITNQMSKKQKAYMRILRNNPEILKKLEQLNVYIDFRELTDDSLGRSSTQCSIVIYHDEKNRVNAEEKNVLSVTYVERCSQLIIITKGERLATYGVKVLSIPDLSCIYEINNIDFNPILTDINNNYLLFIRTGGVDPRSFCYDLLARRLAEISSLPYEITQVWVRTDDGFLIKRRSYVLKLLNEKFEEIRRFDNYFSTTKYVAESNKLLILNNSNYSSFTANKELPRSDRAESRFIPDTLKLLSLSKPDSSIYVGIVKFITNNLVAINKDTGVEVIDFLPVQPVVRLSIHKIKQVKIELLGKLLWIKFKSERNDEITTVIYSIKKQKVIFESQKILTSKPEHMFACYTADPLVQELLYIDTAADEILKTTVKNVRRNELLNRGIYIAPLGDAYYTIEVIAEDSLDIKKFADETFESFLKFRRMNISKLINDHTATSIKLFDINKGYLRTIKTMTRFDTDTPMIAGNFLFFKSVPSNSLVEVLDNNDLGNYFFFKTNLLR